MKFRLSVLLLLFLPMLLSAQKKQKPLLLVNGGGMAGYSAALQAAYSNVPTVLLIESLDDLEELKQARQQISNKYQLDGGLWMSLLMDMALSKTSSDSLAKVVKSDFNSQLAKNALEKLEVKLPNLTIYTGEKLIKCVKGKRNWTVTLSNRVKVSVPVLIDGSAYAALIQEFSPEKRNLPQSDFIAVKDLALAQSRTVLAVGERNQEPVVATLETILASEKDKLFDLAALRQLDNNPNELPLRMAFGQAVGATAAYCAFFKAKAADIDLRKLQAELLAYKARLNPYVDIAYTDPHFGSIQKFFLTGFFMGDKEGDALYFHPDAPVKFDDIKPVLNDVYTRSQLWFLDNYRNDDLTWKDLLSLIKFVSLKGDEVEQALRADWKTKRKFAGDFDLDAKITRRQLAVMADLYSASFAKAILPTGQFKK